jgi:RHS repeat-associated protein
MMKQSRLRRKIEAIALLMLPCAIAGAQGAPWYNSSWSYRRIVIIDHTKVVGSSNLSYFPVLFSVTDNNLRSTAYGGQVAQSNGNDILFTAADGVSKLNHAIETYSPSTGTILAWVQAPTLSPSVNTNLYIYYGNASASNQQNGPGVWDGNYKAVWHLPDGTNLTANDSTYNGNNATPEYVTATAGQIDGGGHFNGSNYSWPSSYMFVNRQGASLDISSSFTVSAWVYLSNFAMQNYVLEKSTAGNNGPNYSLSINSDETAMVAFYDTAYESVNGATRLSNWWSYITGVYDQPSGTLRIYVNGSLDGSTSVSGSPSTNSTDTVYIGVSQLQGASHFGGILDEIRVSNIARSAAWIGTEYNNQNSPGTFLTLGMGTVATPTLSPSGGTYNGAQTVTIATTTPGATIVYTTDGTTPSQGHGTAGTSVIVRSGTVTIKAFAYETAWLDSPVATATYTIAGTATQPNPPPVGTPGADSGNGMDPRRIGVRPLGSYWGAAGEDIDTTSGNLNFSIPLLKVLSRGGWSVAFALSYNSQIWRKDAAGTWWLGYDSGYGLGWMLQAGSIVPVWTSTSQIDHYLYTDSTGAEYSLATNTNGVWTGREGVYISFDTNTNRLYFNDGSFWVMGSQSSGSEPDAGTMYPTLIQDSNGNQITITYDNGNSSSRITSITDPRTTVGFSGTLSPTYTFTYSAGHLNLIQSMVGTPESYSFSYATQPLNSPFSPSISYGSITYLQSMTIYGLGISHQFQYDSTGTGELTQMTTPLGGTLQWQYRAFAYGSGISLREVQTRQMASLSGATPNSWSFTYDGTSSPTYHASTTISDAGTGTSKTYYVSTQNLYNQTVTTLLPYAYAEFNVDSTQPLQLSYTWLEENGNVHKYTEATTLNPNTSNAATKTTYQYRDAYGNLTASYVYDFGNTSGNSDWAYSMTYVTDPNYISRYIRNRLTQATVTRGGVQTTLQSNSYDYYSYPYGLMDRPNLPLHDSTYNASFTYRGNLYFTGPSTLWYSYDIGGVRLTTKDATFVTVTNTPSSSTNYSLPAVLSNGNVSSNISYASSWGVTQVADSTGATTNTTYDTYGRPASSTVADGAVTNYTYTYNPTTQTATITHPPENPNGTTWKRTTLDGFGRTIKVETGHDSTTVSQVDTQYAPCACSPLGKLYRTSQPYAPGGAQVWTTNTYDGSGRTLTVTAPDGSVTHYSYQGNQTTVTDPAGKWKTTVTDAQGNLRQVIEPNPAGGANFATTYTYDGVNHLTNVTMTRPEGTQTRSFVYNGPDLVSATNPENGTVTYTYNGAHQVLTRTDAKNQKTQYTYDTYGRLSAVQHFYNGTPCTCEDTAEQWHYYYDAPIDPYYPATYTGGRLAAVTFGGDGFGAGFTYEYGYNPAGRTTMQRMEVTGIDSNNPTIDLDATYTWDNEGRVTARNYPSVPANQGPNLTYQYDLMGRLSGLTLNGTSQATATYGPASELTNLSYFGYSEARTYNSLLQLTRQTVAGVFDTEYVFPTGQNNGQISSSVDHISGQQVNYTYDALKRLTAAGTTGGTPWGEVYTYDGFGNLNSATVTQGSGVNWANASDPATNRLIGVSYDANGNNITPGAPCCATTYDVENRIVSQYLDRSTPTWIYDPSGKRVAQVPGNTWTLYFYDIFGKQIATLSGDSSYPNTPVSGTTNVYFGSKLVQANGVTVVTDRLGSVRANSNGERFTYLPYGTEQAPTADGRFKFGTYMRDSTGQSQDYADQRYYNPWYGRFNSPDPGAGIDRADPASWNKYAYTGGDPVNRLDPSGTSWCELPLNDSGEIDCQLPPLAELGPYWSTIATAVVDYWTGSWDPVTGLRSRSQGEIDYAKAFALAGLAAVVAAAQSDQQGGRPYPKYLEVTKDYYSCWGHAVQRNVSYQLYDSNDQPLSSGTVTEHLFATDYAASVINLPGHPPDTSSGQANGTFNDEISIQFGPPRSYLQSFTASAPPEGLVGFAGNPVYVDGFGGQYGILNVTKTATYVDINGNRGNPIKCD